MKISRKLAIRIIKYLDQHADFYFPFKIICREYLDGDGEIVEIDLEELKKIIRNKKYRTFELWENLQNLDKKTLKLMAKGFLEEITNKSLEK
jgi:hypothetical protein